MRRRIWCETLGYDAVRSRRVLDLVSRYELELLLAVRPWDLDALGAVADACESRGVSLSLWPMLADEDGRWASAENVDAFAPFVMRVMDAMDSRSVREIAIDLEPPIRTLARVAHGPRPIAGALDVVRGQRKARGGAQKKFAALGDEIRARGAIVSTALFPLVLLDPRTRSERSSIESLLGMPADHLGAAHANVMAYTSIAEGWSRGMLKRDDARALLHATARAAVSRYGKNGGVSIGAVGTGAFGDEPVYRSPRELAEDVAIVRASGAAECTLFDLAGVLSRPPAEAWLDAFAKDDGDHPAFDEFPPRARAALALCACAAWSFRAGAKLWPSRVSGEA